MRQPRPWRSASVLRHEKPTLRLCTVNSQPLLIMLHYAIVFLVVAIIAAILGLTGVAGLATNIAQVLFVLFLVLFIISLITGRKPRQL